MSRINHSSNTTQQTHGQLYYQAIYTRSNFNQLGEKDYVLILNEQSHLENWDKRVIEEYNSVGSESGSAIQLPTCQPKQSTKFNSHPLPHQLCLEISEICEDNTIDSSDSSVQNTHPFTILERDDMYNIICRKTACG